MTKNELIERLKKQETEINYDCLQYTLGKSSGLSDAIKLAEQLDPHPQHNDDECELRTVNDAMNMSIKVYCTKCSPKGFQFITGIYDFAGVNYCPNCGSRIKRTNGTKDGGV